jgi:hypothetical protein
LPNNERRDTHTDTQTDGRDKYTADMGSVAIKNIPSFTEIGSDIPRYTWRGYTDRMEIAHAYCRRAGHKLCRYSNRHAGVRSHEYNCKSEEEAVKNVKFEASKEVTAEIVNYWVMTSFCFVSDTDVSEELTPSYFRIGMCRHFMLENYNDGGHETEGERV